MEESLDYLPNHPEIKLFQDHSMICINTDTMVLGEFLEVYRHDTVLDIGTNNGSLLLYANRWNAKKLIGVDINSRALELAKKNLELNDIKNYELINADAKTLRIDPVDVVICKGQGNYEGLMDCQKEQLYFLFMVNHQMVKKVSMNSL